MRYQLTLDIEAPRERVLELFLDVENLKQWQPSLVRFDQISGDGMRGVGSTSKQLHRMGQREVEMLATVTVDNYPDEFAATFEADDVWNLIENRFVELNRDRTNWTVTSDLRSTSFMMKLLMMVLPSMFKKQTRAFMGYFKEFVERSAVDFEKRLTH
jgi:hypothetical protein